LLTFSRSSRRRGSWTRADRGDGARGRLALRGSSSRCCSKPRSLPATRYGSPDPVRCLPRPQDARGLRLHRPARRREAADLAPEGRRGRSPLTSARFRTRPSAVLPVIRYSRIRPSRPRSSLRRTVCCAAMASLHVDTHGTARYQRNPEDYWRWTHAGLVELFNSVRAVERRLRLPEWRTGGSAYLLHWPRLPDCRPQAWPPLLLAQAVTVVLERRGMASRQVTASTLCRTSARSCAELLGCRRPVMRGLGP
jgi:hypothetical protein